MIYRVSQFTDLHPIDWFPVDFFFIFGFTENLLDLWQASNIEKNYVGLYISYGLIYINQKKSTDISVWFIIFTWIYHWSSCFPIDLPIYDFNYTRFTMNFMIYNRFSDLLIHWFPPGKSRVYEISSNVIPLGHHPYVLPWTTYKWRFYFPIVDPFYFRKNKLSLLLLLGTTHSVLKFH